MGDICEMEPVNYIDSSTYTVLSQSKPFRTALLMWVMDGTAQNLTQWLHRAFAVTCFHSQRSKLIMTAPLMWVMDGTGDIGEMEPVSYIASFAAHFSGYAHGGLCIHVSEL